MDTNIINLLVTLGTITLTIMFIIVYKIFYCKHDYQFIKEISIYKKSSDKIPYKFERIFECSKCKRVKINEL